MLDLIWHSSPHSDYVWPLISNDALQTDLNPVSGISKLTQLFFALIVPGSHKYSVLINLIAGAVSEAVSSKALPPGGQLETDTAAAV